MKIKKFEKMIKKAFRSVEANPNVTIKKTEKTYLLWYSYKFNPRTEAGFKFCAYFHSEASESNPYRMVTFLRETMDDYFTGENFKLRRDINELTE